jgi:DNA topoisomerase-6 subunit B
MLKRPVPNLDRTITKIMNVIWVQSKTESRKNMKRVAYNVYNYTAVPRSFRIHMRLPPESVDDTIKGAHFLEINEEGKAAWEIKDLPSASMAAIGFDLIGDMADTFSDDDVYISGVNPTIVMGAEPLPGDWGIKGMEIIELDSDLDAEEDEEDEEEGLDDDE